MGQFAQKSSYLPQAESSCDWLNLLANNGVTKFISNECQINLNNLKPWPDESKLMWEPLYKG